VKNARRNKLIAGVVKGIMEGTAIGLVGTVAWQHSER
jgi:phage shock protein PspC (stress-responsive transcriptional regulator)